MTTPSSPRPARRPALRWLVALLAALTLTGCAVSGTGPARTPATLAASTSPSVDLTQPGAARQAVAMLQAQTQGLPIVRVTVTRADATLTYVKDDKTVTLDWEGGDVVPVDSGITYVDQTPFDPADFDLGDVGALFSQASAVAGSHSNQELQINEYNQGKVLMTVTTSPESQTIFFRPDATMIDAVSLTTTAGVAEALADTTGDGAEVVQIGADATSFWADVRVSQTQIEHRVRPAKLPSYTVVRNASTKQEAFSPTQVQPAVLARLLATLPAQLGSPNSTVSMVMDMRDGLAYPTMRFTVGLTTVVYSPSGVDITKQVH